MGPLHRRGHDAFKHRVRCLAALTVGGFELGQPKACPLGVGHGHDVGEGCDRVQHVQARAAVLGQCAGHAQSSFEAILGVGVHQDGFDAVHQGLRIEVDGPLFCAPAEGTLTPRNIRVV
jgi:hypothetical protein